MKSKIVHQVRKLCIASDSFQQCLSLLRHIGDMKLTSENELYPPMIAGVVVTYAKNFNRADGLGPLPKAYSRFPASKFRTAHEKLIESRNKLYAHRDRAAHSFKNSEGVASEYPVYVRINDENTAFLFQPKLVDIAPKRIQDIGKLIQFQRDRLQEDIDQKLSVIVDFEKGYKQGVVYLLGEDFP